MKIIQGKFLFILLMVVAFTFGFSAININAANYPEYGDNPFQLIDYQFEDLKEEQELKNFSVEGKNKLMDLASQFGENEKNKSFALDTNNNSTINFINEEDLTVERMIFKPLPGLLFETNYNKEEDKYRINVSSDINMRYDIDDNTSITASYNLINEDFEEDIDDFEENNIYEMKSSSDSEDILRESKSKESVGIEYQTSDHIRLLADYGSDNIFSNFEEYSTSLGLEYTEEKGKITASYLLEKSEEMEERITGIELDLKNMGRITASYKLYNPEYIRNQLQKESTWDLGVDVNLSEITSFSLGYEFINNQVSAADTTENNGSEENNSSNSEITDDFDDNQESSIEASLQIKF